MTDASNGRDGYEGLVSKFDDVLGLLNPDEQAALASIIAIAGERLDSEGDVEGFILPNTTSSTDAYARKGSSAHRDPVREAVLDILRKMSGIKGID